MSYGYSQYPLREEPSTYFDEPSAYINEPSAYINEPSAYFDGPSAYFGEPSAYFNEPSSDIPVEDSQDPFGSDTVHEAAAPASPQDNLNQILPLNPYPAWPHGGYSTGAEIDHPVPPEAISHTLPQGDWNDSQSLNWVTHHPPTYDPSIAPASLQGSSDQTQSLLPPPALTSPQGGFGQFQVESPQSSAPSLSMRYQCRIQPEGGEMCGQLVRGHRNDLRAHLKARHGVNMKDKRTKVPCTWNGCHKRMNGENLNRHILKDHLCFQWKCSFCQCWLARDDVIRKHRRESENEGCRTATAVVVPGPGGTL